MLISLDCTKYTLMLLKIGSEYLLTVVCGNQVKSKPPSYLNGLSGLTPRSVTAEVEDTFC